MSTPGPIPEPLFHFIEQNIDSIDQLEILRILGESPEKQWKAADLAVEAQIRPSAIAEHLSALEQRGLLRTQVVENQLVCHYSPGPTVERQLSDLLQFYKERPVTLIKMVYARATHPLQAFADSFRFRKET